MNTKKLLIGVALGAVIFSTMGKYAYSTTEPSFPSCLNTQGTLKAKYDNGTHGIVGDLTTYSGKDEVYALTENTLVQCFCPENGNGIQTNWWRTDEFEVKDIEYYQNLGWILVPNGEKWGLNNAQYMAKNFSYNCIGGSSTTTITNITNITNTTNNTTNNNTTNNNTTNNIGGHEVGIGQVLALASTGNIVFIYSTALLGISLIVVGFFAARKSNKRS